MESELWKKSVIFLYKKVLLSTWLICVSKCVSCHFDTHEQPRVCVSFNLSHSLTLWLLECIENAADSFVLEAAPCVTLLLCRFSHLGRAPQAFGMAGGRGQLWRVASPLGSAVGSAASCEPRGRCSWCWCAVQQTSSKQ